MYCLSEKNVLSIIIDKYKNTTLKKVGLVFRLKFLITIEED